MAVIKWTTPERRAGNNALSLVPNEVYLEIFDYIDVAEDLTLPERKRVLSNLALVCRFFCAIALPRLFREISFVGISGERRSFLFCQNVVNNQEVASTLAFHVKSCTFSHWRVSHSWTRMFLKLCTQALFRFTNLEELVLRQTTLTTSFCEAIRSLKNLKSLTIHACDFDTPAVCDMSANLPPLDLTRFELQQHFDPNTCFCFVNVINHSRLRVLWTDNWQFIREFFKREVAFVLEELSISIVDMNEIPLLQEILDHLPSLRGLSIIDSFSQGPPPFSVLQSSLPLLHKLSCSWYLVDTLVPGRPIKSLTIPCGQHNPSTWLTPSLPGAVVLSALKRSTADIEALHLPAELYLEEPFDNFPRLRCLRLEHSPLLLSSGETVDQLCWNPLRQLPIKELSLIFHSIHSIPWRWNLRMQFELLSSLTAAFPTVTQVQIVHTVEWRKHHQTLQWQPSICPPFRQEVKDAIKNEPWVKDFNGCFAAVFQPAELTDHIRDVLDLPIMVD